MLHHGGTTLAPNFGAVEKMFKNKCSKNGVGKIKSQNTSETAEYVTRAINTICSERPDMQHVSDFWVAFGAPYGEFVSVCEKCDSMFQKIIKKTHQTVVERGHAGDLNRGV